jgi:two-component sensor histidine kinase
MGVGEAAATTLALVIHELATNSLKYGALSSDAGTLDISCDTPGEEMTIVWTERGGPSVKPPETVGGYGSKLLQRSVSTQLDGSIEYDWQPDGIVVTLKLRAETLTA